MPLEGKADGSGVAPPPGPLFRAWMRARSEQGLDAEADHVLTLLDEIDELREVMQRLAESAVANARLLTGKGG